MLAKSLDMYTKRTVLFFEFRQLYRFRCICVEVFDIGNYVNNVRCSKFGHFTIQRNSITTKRLTLQKMPLGNHFPPKKHYEQVGVRTSSPCRSTPLHGFHDLCKLPRTCPRQSAANIGRMYFRQEGIIDNNRLAVESAC